MPLKKRARIKNMSVHSVQDWIRKKLPQWVFDYESISAEHYKSVLALKYTEVEIEKLYKFLHGQFCYNTNDLRWVCLLSKIPFKIDTEDDEQMSLLLDILWNKINPKWKVKAWFKERGHTDVSFLDRDEPSIAGY